MSTSPLRSVRDTADAPLPVEADLRAKADRLTADLVETFQRVLGHERATLDEVAARLGLETENIALACRTLLGTPESRGQRRLVVSGLGKAGLIARKVAATFSSMGTAAVFIHPVEALHGDLGFVQPTDCGLLFSHSGETVEVVRLASELGRLGCPVVAITQSHTSTLGRRSTACLALGVVEEGCFLGLAPTSSTTVMLAVGDAVAQAVAKAKGFREEDFANNHPGGSLGLRFRSVRDVMRVPPRLVCVGPETVIKDVVKVVSAAKTGAAVVVQPNGTLIGIFTDGDLRRACLRGGDVLDQPVEQCATIPCRAIDNTTTVADALKILQNHHIEDLPVVDTISNVVLGLLCLKDIPAF
jgi:arabinose-5-phosphate isomerase